MKNIVFLQIFPLLVARFVVFRNFLQEISFILDFFLSGLYPVQKIIWFIFGIYKQKKLYKN